LKKHSQLLTKRIGGSDLFISGARQKEVATHRVLEDLANDGMMGRPLVHGNMTTGVPGFLQIAFGAT